MGAECMWLRATDAEARKQKAARKRPVILMLAKDQAWPAGHRSGVHGFQLDTERQQVACI